MKINFALSIQHSALVNWLPDMDLNHDKQIQSLLCYRYTIGQTGPVKIESNHMESSLYLDRAVPITPPVIVWPRKEKRQRTGRTPKRYRATHGYAESARFWSAASPLPLLRKAFGVADHVNGAHYFNPRISHFSLP